MHRILSWYGTVPDLECSHSTCSAPLHCHSQKLLWYPLVLVLTVTMMGLDPQCDGDADERCWCGSSHHAGCCLHFSFSQCLEITSDVPAGQMARV